MNEHLIIESLVPLVAVVATFLSATLIMHTFFTTRNKERLALIAKNKDSSIWRKPKTKGSGIKFGILLISTGLGTLAGFVAHAILGFPLVVTLLSAIPMFMGFGILYYHHRYTEDDYHDHV